jgi:hypothetical protein
MQWLGLIVPAFELSGRRSKFCQRLVEECEIRLSDDRLKVEFAKEFPNVFGTHQVSPRARL